MQPRGLLNDYRLRPASRVLWIAGSGGEMVPGICLPVWNLRSRRQLSAEAENQLDRQ